MQCLNFSDAVLVLRVCGRVNHDSSMLIILLVFSTLQGLVIAGLADYARPADKLSLSQSSALTATGWQRD
jgi:Mitochondrial pyruvate carriers